MILSAGSSRLHSSSSLTDSEPGRVEQAPKSRMSAPSPSIPSTLRRKTASSSLPSEASILLPAKKESPVMLTMPIMRIFLPALLSMAHKINQKLNIFVS